MKLSPHTAPVEPEDLLIRMHNLFGAAVERHRQALRGRLPLAVPRLRGPLGVPRHGHPGLHPYEGQHPRR